MNKFSFYKLFYSFQFSLVVSFVFSNQMSISVSNHLFYFHIQLFSLPLKFSPQEKSWTYKCVGERCVRENYTAGIKRVPFMSCSMICGTSNIWPMPTGKVSLSSRSLTFKSHQIQFDIQSEFDEAKQLLRSAYNVFLIDLKTLEQQHHKHTKTQNNLDKNNNHEINERRGDKIGNGEIGMNNGIPAAEAAAATSDTTNDRIDDNAKQNCDINKIMISAEIQKSGDTSLHMDIDESYELNVTSMNN